MTILELSEAFRQQFGGEPDRIAIAPGRVNLIGEHTDYNDGFVFPVAIDRVTMIAARRTEGNSTIHSMELGDGESFEANSVVLNQVSGWASYAAGMAYVLAKPGRTLSNFEALVTSSIPMGSGVSSSAALELAFGVLWNDTDKLALTKQELAVLGQKCENQYVGVNCGIMDQMASALGQENHALFIDILTLEVKAVPLSPALAIVLCDTKKPRALTESAYNERRKACEEVAKILGVKSLRFATMEALVGATSELENVLFRRAKHVITENQRCLTFAKALQMDDFATMGELMKASHESLQFDYEVSCDELDEMAAAAWSAPGCVGARMTGAGFGGACVALVHKDQTDAFIEATLRSYKSSSGKRGDAMVCHAVQGARTIER